MPSKRAKKLKLKDKEVLPSDPQNPFSGLAEEEEQFDEDEVEEEKKPEIKPESQQSKLKKQTQPQQPQPQIKHIFAYTEKEKAIIRKQFTFFEIQENDDENKKINKQRIVEIMKDLESRHILGGKTFEEYENFLYEFEGGEATVFIVEEIDPVTGEKVLKALKRKRLNISKNISFFKEIKMLCTINHKNIIKIESIFFEYDKRNRQYFCTIVMPFIKFSFMSWLLKVDKHDIQYFDMQDNKRSFEEIRKVLIGALEGLNYLHENKILHLDMKFDNLLINEASECIITDLGLGKELTQLTSQIGGTWGSVSSFFSHSKIFFSYFFAFFKQFHGS